MRTLPLGLLLASSVCAVWAQTGPVVLPRGIVNAFTQLPAPAFVGRGGIVQINGLNLGPAVGLKASGTTLPTQLGDVQVLINGKPVPLFSADIGTIVAQVPVDAAIGTAELVVQRGGASSPPAHFVIQPANPSIKTADGSGFGLPWGTITGRNSDAERTGLGPTIRRSTAARRWRAPRLRRPSMHSSAGCARPLLLKHLPRASASSIFR